MYINVLYLGVEALHKHVRHSEGAGMVVGQEVDRDPNHHRYGHRKVTDQTPDLHTYGTYITHT